MPTIAFHICPQTVCSSLTQALDALALANHLAGERLFNLQRFSHDGQSVRLGYARIEVDGDLAMAEQADLILLPATGSAIDQTLAANRSFIDWLRQRPPSQALASICSSAFLLAESGQLDGGLATTHWALAERFRQRYPQITLDCRALHTRHGLRRCSGGAQAGLDLCLELIAEHAGEWLAQRVAETLVVARRRGSQSRYRSLLPAPRSADPAVLALLGEMQRQPAANHGTEALAERLHCSPRTLLRRFQQATGLTPNDYLQRLRISAAQQALHDPRRSLESIALAVGYQDRAGFIRLFKRLCGETPGSFRRRLQQDAAD
ncbi:GlxA family transcriptional regulator [Pseudomonas mangrovi]|uniref:Transcriptional regulator n=1 Tax=Pseudomonas mangrovi TaxID=2161748 RepID=A0A2T5PCI6_9PSED|nr:helix-turn-helix domain-containing protein [Pseudomonas mangrovi]PTU75439.1 transcriptional regulator [Pseudomonas mangrovi]